MKISKHILKLVNISYSLTVFVSLNALSAPNQIPTNNQVREEGVNRRIENPDLKQPNDCLQKALKSSKGHIKAKVSQEYFNDIHDNSTSNCLELKPGKVYQVYGEHSNWIGKKTIKLRDPETDLYFEIPEKYLDFAGEFAGHRQASINTKYFTSKKTMSIKSCFTLSRDKTYAVDDAHFAQGILMVEIKNDGGLSQWLPIYRLDLLDQKLLQKCNISKPASTGTLPVSGSAPAAQ